MSKTKKYYYTFAYIISLLLPSLFFLRFVRVDFKTMVFTIIMVLIIGGLFDIWAVRQGKRDTFFIWQYNDKSIIGIKFFGVPIEDYILFLFLTPIFIVSLYKFIEYFFDI